LNEKLWNVASLCVAVISIIITEGSGLSGVGGGERNELEDSRATAGGSGVFGLGGATVWDTVEMRCEWSLAMGLPDRGGGRLAAGLGVIKKNVGLHGKGGPNGVGFR